MSTENNQLPSDEQVEAYVRKVAAEEAAKFAKPGANPQEVNPEPIVLNIGGQQMTFKNQDEASAQLTSLYAQKPNQVTERPLPGQQVTDDTNNAWSPTKHAQWVDLMVTNPLAAQEMLDEQRYGVKNPTEVIKQQMAAVQEIAQQMTIDQFVSQHKDYVVSEENAKAMQGVLTELGGGRPAVSKMALEAAYAIADKRGLIKRPEAQNTYSNRQDNPYLAAPPISGRGSSNSGPSDFDIDAENMSLDSIEKFFLKHGS